MSPLAWTCLAILSCACSLPAQTPLEVLTRLDAAEALQHPQRATLVYQEIQENWRYDSLSRLDPASARSKTFDVLFLSGQRYRKLIAREHQPLSPLESASVEEDLRRFLASPPAPVLSTPPIYAALANTHTLSLSPEPDTTYLLSAEPLSPSQPRYTLRIDARSFRLLEHRTEYLAPHAGLLPGTSITSHYAPLPSGLHVLIRVEIDFWTAPTPGHFLHGRQLTTYRNHRPSSSS